MRRLINVTIMAGALALAAVAPAASAAEPGPFCYTICQYECYLAFPGGGPAWEACYVACARDECQA